MVETYSKYRSVSMDYRDVCDKCKQNEMKTMMKNCLGDVTKRLLNLYLTIGVGFFFFHDFLKQGSL